MFLGHFALGFAAKRLDPELSLGTGFAAAQLADLVWPFLVLAGVERVAIAPGDTVVTPLRFESYPWTHSLLLGAGWAALAAGLHFAARRRPRAALIVAALVLSHWLLDFVSHRADMPLAPGLPTRLGLGLWNSLPATLIVEGLLFAAGVAAYATATRAADALGRWGLALLVGFLLVAYAGAVFGPPPPSVTAVAATGVLAWLLPLWGYRLDRHRRART